MSLGLSDEAFARQYGFGLSTLIDYQATGTSRIDPNVRIAQSLSVGARRVYSREKAACAERVRAEVGDPPGVMRGPLEEGEEITAVSDRANADPRIAAARDAYSRCIAEKGYRGSTGEDLSSRFFEDTVPYRTAYESLSPRLSKLERTRPGGDWTRSSPVSSAYGSGRSSRRRSRRRSRTGSAARCSTQW